METLQQKKPRGFLLVHAKVTSLFHPPAPPSVAREPRGLFEVSLACRRILPVRLVVLTPWTMELLLLEHEEFDCPDLLGGA